MKNYTKILISFLALVFMVATSSSVFGQRAKSTKPLRSFPKNTSSPSVLILDLAFPGNKKYEELINRRLKRDYQRVFKGNQKIFTPELVGKQLEKNELILEENCKSGLCAKEVQGILKAKNVIWGKLSNLRQTSKKDEFVLSVDLRLSSGNVDKKHYLDENCTETELLDKIIDFVKKAETSVVVAKTPPPVRKPIVDTKIPVQKSGFERFNRWLKDSNTSNKASIMGIPKKYVTWAAETGIVASLAGIVYLSTSSSPSPTVGTPISPTEPGKDGTSGSIRTGKR